MKAEISSIFIALLVGIAGAHDWGFGSCSTLPPVKGFNVDKFLGLWYVIELFDSSSTCQTLNYTRLSETQLAVTKSRQLVVLDTLKIDHSNTYTGKLDIPDGDNAGQMRIKWPWNVAGKGDYIVFDTDYDIYGAIFECQQISVFAHRQSAAILSRSPTLDVTYRERVKRLMLEKSISYNHFDLIDHSVCTQRSESDVNIDIDDKTLGDIVSNAGDGIRTVATQLRNLLQVINGASSLANTVKDVSKRFGSSSSGQIVADPDVEIIS